MSQDDAHDAVQAFMSYTQAFGSGDPHTLVKYFHAPAIMDNPSGVFVLQSPADIEHAYRPVMEQLPALGYERSVFPDLRGRRLSPDLALVESSCIWEDGHGRPLRSFGVCYTLRSSEGAWKILSALVYARD